MGTRCTLQCGVILPIPLRIKLTVFHPWPFVRQSRYFYWPVLVRAGVHAAGFRAPVVRKRVRGPNHGYPVHATVWRHSTDSFENKIDRISSLALRSAIEVLLLARACPGGRARSRVPGTGSAETGAWSEPW